MSCCFDTGGRKWVPADSTAARPFAGPADPSRVSAAS